MVLTILEGDDAKVEARRLVRQAQGSSDIINLLSTIIVYKFSNLSRDEVDAVLGIELEQTRVYQEAQIDGEQRLVLKQLARKFGVITPESRSRVSSLTIDRVEALGEALLDFTSMADLEAWLSQN
jgi:predicted transposase YdaD